VARAAGQGSAPAQFGLGVIHHKGEAAHPVKILGLPPPGRSLRACYLLTIGSSGALEACRVSKHG